MSKRYKVLYLVNIPAPYMVNYFNELGKYCDLTVIFEKDRSTERDSSWREYEFKTFRGIILKGISTAVDAAFCPQVVFYLKKDWYDFIFISNMATPTGIVAIEYLKLRKTQYILESEGGFAKDGKGFKEKFKKHLMSNAYKYFSTSPIGDEYFLQYGATADKFVKYPFTSLYQNDIQKSIIDDEMKEPLRQELGMKEKRIIISVGQFIHRKGFDLLMKASNVLSKDVGIYIVGGNPTEEYIAMKKTLELGNVHFEGFKRKEELAKFYKAADLFVFPTREDIWGLVINEAMAYGLPVITTDKCIAGMELVEDGENGYIVPVGSVEQLTEKINKVLANEGKRKYMGRKSLQKAQWYTFESMVDVHMKFFKCVESSES